MVEKRQYFRIQQDVIFDAVPVSTDIVANIGPEQHFDHARAFGLLNEFQNLDSEVHNTLEEIREDNPPLATCLDTLNHKLNLLAQQLLASEMITANDKNSGVLDVSQGGIGFRTSTPLGIETWVAVKLVFLPSYATLVTYAQVSRNRLQADGNYLIGARFHQLNDEQQRLLAREVMASQRLQRMKEKSQIRH